MLHHQIVVLLTILYSILVSTTSVTTPKSKILAIVPTPSYSHQVVFHPIWRELSLKGHQVTLITTDPLNEPKLTNLKEIDISFAYDILVKQHNITNQINEIGDDILKMIDMFIELLHDLNDQVLEAESVKELIDSEEEFDLIMIEAIHPTLFAFQHRFKCPFIGVASLEIPYAGHKAMGNPVHPILYPEVTYPFTGELSFFERCLAVALYTFMAYYDYFVIIPREDETVRKHFGPGYPSLLEIRDEVDLLLVNANPVLQPARPTVPGTIYIGGGIHIRDQKPLPKDIQTFLDDAKEGIVYFSLGSNVKSKDIPDKTRQVILDTFKDLPYKVLWKFEAETLEGKPDNVKIMKWIPQQDVLRHKNIKVFITQGGLQSTEESLFNHVPLVVMPFFGDQEMNAKRIEMKGFGLSVDHKTLEKTKFTETLMEVIKNPKYRNTAKELAELALDEPMTGLEKAVWWTEYVIRHKGAKHLKGPAVNLPLYQYFFLDIIAFVSAILISILLVLFFIFRFIKRLLFGQGKKKDKKKLKTT